MSCPAVPECPARGRIRPCCDCFCHHPEVGAGGVVPLEICLTCKFPASMEPIPPPRPKVGDVFTGILKRWHGVEDRVLRVDGSECPCDEIRQVMNARGAAWCDENVDWIAGQVADSLDATDRRERRLPRWAKLGYLRWQIRRAVRIVRDWTPATPAISSPQPPASSSPALQR